MGPGDTANTMDINTANELGKLIAREGWILLTGGRNVGVMHAASQGAKEAGGMTIGILPTADSVHLSEFIDIPIFTDMGNGRNNINVLSSQVILACGMGIGTASEIALALKAQKPVVLLNVDQIGQRFFTHLAEPLVSVAPSPRSAIRQIHTLL